MHNHWSKCLWAVALLNVLGCSQTPPADATADSSQAAATVLLSVTSDAGAKPQSVDMALKLAGFTLDEGRRAVLFFNVKGVTIPSKSLGDEFAFQQEKPIHDQLAELIQRGADVHVCPICMKALGVAETDLIEGAHVTTRPSLFANITADTVVFTY